MKNINYISFILGVLFILLIGAGNSSIRQREMCQSVLQAESQTALTNAGEFYAISGTFADGCISGFDVDSNGVVVYNGAGGRFLFNGASDLQADKVCEITYSLYLNGVQTALVTPVTFAHAQAYCNISITNIIELSRGDTLRVFAKSNTENTTITVANLRITFFGG